MARWKREIDAFDAANALVISYQASHTIRNIRSGFHKTGAWNYDEWGPSLSTLRDSIQLEAKSSRNITSLSDLLTAFEKKSRTLLATPVIEVGERGTVRVNVSSGVSYTAADVLDALRTKEEMTKAREQAALLKSSLQSYIEHSVDNDKTKDTATEIGRLEELRPRRLIQKN